MAKTTSKTLKGEAQARAVALPGAFNLFKPSWEAFKLNWKAFILPWLLPLIVLGVILGMAGAVVPEIQNRVRMQHPNDNLSFDSGRSIVFNIIAAILGSAATVAVLFMAAAYMYYVKVQSAKGMKLKIWPALRASLHYFWRLLGLGIIRSVIIIVGFILLIVPGLIMWRRYMLAPYYLVDRDIGIMEALRRSAVDSKPFSSALWGMIGIYVLLAVIGQLPIIGLISVAGSIAYSCAAAVRYFQIKAAK